MRDVLSMAPRAQLIQEILSIDEFTPADLHHGLPEISFLLRRKTAGRTAIPLLRCFLGRRVS